MTGLCSIWFSVADIASRRTCELIQGSITKEDVDAYEAWPAAEHAHVEGRRVQTSFGVLPLVAYLLQRALPEKLQLCETALLRTCFLQGPSFWGVFSVACYRVKPSWDRVWKGL